MYVHTHTNTYMLTSVLKVLIKLFYYVFILS